MMNDHIPDWIASCPNDAPTTSSAMIRAGAGNLPDFKMFARSPASFTSKRPEIWELPPLISSFTLGEDATIPSSTIAMQRPILSFVKRAHVLVPSPFICMETTGRPC